jgi:hypothetical protein
MIKVATSSGTYETTAEDWKVTPEGHLNLFVDGEVMATFPVGKWDAVFDVDVEDGYKVVYADDEEDDEALDPESVQERNFLAGFGEGRS